MIQAKGNDMGRFSVEIEVANNVDVQKSLDGELPSENVRRMSIRGVVDTGATRLVIPESVAERLGVRSVGSASVRYADGRTAQRGMVGNIHLTCLGRSSIFNAIVEPDRESALIGAIVLEDLDFVADGSSQRLSPRDPRQIVSEIE